MTTGFLTDSGIRVWSQTVNDETFDVAPHGRLAVRGARLDGCIFSGLHLKEFIFQGCERSVFSGCRFVNCRIDEWHHTFMDFVDCEFESVKIKKWRLDEGDVVDCRFEGAIADAVIWGDTAAKSGIEYRRNRFERNDLSGVDPCSVDFRSGVDLATNVLPGSGGCAPLLVLGCGPQVAQAALDRLGEVPEELRAAAEQYLSVSLWAMHLGSGQKDWFGWPLRSTSPEVWAEVLGLVRTVEAEMSGEH